MIEHAVDINIERSPEDVLSLISDAATHPGREDPSAWTEPDEPGPCTSGREPARFAEKLIARASRRPVDENLRRMKDTLEGHETDR